MTAIISQKLNNNIINTSADWYILDSINYLQSKKSNIFCISEEEFNKNIMNFSNYYFTKYEKKLDNILFLGFFAKERNSPIILSDKKPNWISQVRIFIFQPASIPDLSGLNYKCSLLSPYAYVVKNTLENIYWFPHCIIYDCDFNENPLNKVFISGAGIIQKRKKITAYPIRKIMYEKSFTNSNLECMPRKVPYRVSKDIDTSKMMFGTNYIKKLNEYLCCFTCEANKERPFILAKFFEILSSGSLLLTINPITKKYFSKFGFIDGKHYISATLENIDAKIEYIVDKKNRQVIDEIRRNGYNLVYKFHTYKNRGDYLGKIIENEKEFIKYNDGIFNKEYKYEKTNFINNSDTKR